MIAGIFDLLVNKNQFASKEPYELTESNIVFEFVREDDNRVTVIDTIKDFHMMCFLDDVAYDMRSKDEADLVSFLSERLTA